MEQDIQKTPDFGDKLQIISSLSVNLCSVILHSFLIIMNDIVISYQSLQMIAFEYACIFPTRPKNNKNQ